MDNHERVCVMHTQANIRRAVVFACVCAIANHQMCFRGIGLTETLVIRIFHAVTLVGWCLAERGWYTSKCGSYVLVRKIRSVR